KAFTGRTNVIEVKVPTESVGIVIGRGGSNIKQIQERTNTRINFKETRDTDEVYRLCQIRGSADAVQMAESLILDAILNQPVIETFEMWVPQKTCGIIIGRCGDNIRAISKQSNAHVIVDRSSSSRDRDAPVQVVIKGTAEQIAVAKSLIEHKIEEVDSNRALMQQSLANRSPRHRRNKQTNNSATVEEERRHERLTGSSGDSMIQVYVSSVANPTHFWLQLISPKAVDLDHLVDDMTEYYSKEENRELHKLTEVVKGQVVASQFELDDKWYRVEVCGVEPPPEGQDPGESVVDVFYVDYGDSTFRKLSTLCQLRTDFLALRFQAIECSMEGIRPKGDTWTEEAIVAFEDLCHTAQWKAMMAQVMCYKERQMSHRAGSPIPCVRLYDPSAQVTKQVFSTKNRLFKVEYVCLIFVEQSNLYWCSA
ncbi:hypothetical protein AAG570_014081, partial [Ranatra chinensis]